MCLQKIAGLIVSVACLVTLSACKKEQLVIIKYKQVANCYVFDKEPSGQPHTTTSAGNGMFMIYRITAIQNTGKDAVDFNFQLSKLYASDTGEVSGNTSLDNLVKTAPDNKLVPKGTTATNIGRIIINVAGDPNQLKTAKQALHYNSSQGESVLPADEDSGTNTTKFLDPCTPNNLP